MAAAQILSFPHEPDPDLRGILQQMRYVSQATNTKESYAKTWKKFSAFCAERGVDPEMADMEVIGRYLVSLFKNGRSFAGIRAAAAGLRFRFVQNHLWTPEHSNLVRAIVENFARERAQDGHMLQRQAAPITRQIYGKLERAAVRAAEKAKTEWRRGDIMTDLALISVMRDGLLRRSEALALNWEHIDRDVEPDEDEEYVAEGCAVGYIVQSKTDQMGAGHYFYLSPRTMRYLDQMGHPQTGPVFVSRHGRRVCERTVNNRIRRAIKRAGLNPAGYSGHSPRVGMAHDLARAGYSTAEIQRDGRWRQEATVQRYLRKIAPHSNIVARWHRLRDTQERGWTVKNRKVAERRMAAVEEARA